LSPVDETEARAFFLATSRFLEDRGYLHYEISNFAKGHAAISRHNRKYWRRVPYLGLGPSAHSFDGERRWWNAASVRGYCEALEGGAPPVAGEERLSQEQADLERIALGLRMQEGLDLRSITEMTKSGAMLQRLVSEGLVRVEGERVMPTREGYAVADALPLYLFDSP
jgi:oxygen-independent coproporphyrinogen-3 oxidase